MRKNIKLIGLALLLISCLSAGEAAAKVRLIKGKEIKVKFKSGIVLKSDKLQQELEVPIYLAQDIEVGGETIVEAGAEGKARVVEIVESSRRGKPGHIKIAFMELGTKGKYRTANNEMIKLDGIVGGDGKSRKWLSWIFIFGLFINGSEGEIDNTQEFTATIKETIGLDAE